MKNIYKMTGAKYEGAHHDGVYGTRLYCYVEAENMDEAYRISRSTFGSVITGSQMLARNERMDKTLPFFTQKESDG